MGNHVSCISPVASNHKKNVIKVFHIETGALSELEGPVTAAEVMMEFPAQFLCCVSSAASMGRRIGAVLADEVLRASELYVLLPMQRVNTRFSMDDMAFLDELASQGSRRKKGARSQSKIAPLPASLSSADQCFNAEGFTMGCPSFQQSRASLGTNEQEPPPFLKGERSNDVHGICRSKPWMPKLETIAEVHAT